MTRCRLRQIPVLILLTIWFAMGDPGEAKTYGYIIAEDGSVLKLDTDTDTIVSTRMLPPVPMIGSGNWDVYVSGPDNLLLLSYYTSQTRGDVNDFRIAAFDLRTLAFKKDLGVLLKERPDILIPPFGPDFFILWFDPSANNGQGARHVTRYNKATLNSLGDLPQTPEVLRTVFSADGTRLYSFPTSPSKPIRILNSTDLGLIASLDVNLFLDPQGFGARIDDLRGDRALITQGMKPIGVDPIELRLFTVRLSDGAPSPKIALILYGNAYLTPSADRIVFNEETYVRETPGVLREVRSVGRLHVYDVTTGARLGQVTFPVRGPGGIWAIHPSGDKVYFRMLPAPDQDYVVAVISLTSFSVVKELKVPSASIFFVEENP